MYANIIDFHALLTPTPPAPQQKFSQEIKDYLQRYPDTELVDIYLNDLNGQFRGKRIAVSALFSLQNGCYFPQSIYAMDLNGQVIEDSGLGQHAGEPDRLCLPVPGTLRPCARDPQHIAQLQLTMRETNGDPCRIEPRVVLERVLHRLHRLGYYPVIAAELEFYLHAPHQLPGMAQPSLTQNFSVDAPECHGALLDDIAHHAKLQTIPLTGVVAEAAAGQYELNLQHSSKVLEACDQILALKRLTRQLAEKHHQHACFMAKPCAKAAGSGLHFHISLQDAQGHNWLASQPDTLSSTMRQVIGGMLALMPASMAILAPNINAFRRFRPDMHVPLCASWGYNNRTVALRLPCADNANQRVEYRLAGADANPYLAIATILAGMLYGLENPTPLPPAATGDGHATPQAAPLPLNQPQALELFRQNAYLQALFGPAFGSLWHTCKSAELRQFEQQITDTEMAWML
ncbi:glutamine synthetase family protein [Serratia odorifera]|uniref:glutamine synthetase family protein n=1 Tax=Serratia odorifera TaxID=618 RepID=UPI002361B7AA|nr:glutamine synthetase family protein [Serratia odorifera]